MNDILEGPCWNCDGKRTDPRKRSRKCPTCEGSGSLEYCYTCGEAMLCGGRDPNAMYGFMGDAPPCRRKGRSDKRTHREIVEGGDT